jgi:hypothetical protein
MKRLAHRLVAAEGPHDLAISGEHRDCRIHAKGDVADDPPPAAPPHEAVGGRSRLRRHERDTGWAMSQENVEIVRRWLEGLPEDPEDFPALVAESWESDGDYYPVRSFPEARPWRSWSSGR